MHAYANMPTNLRCINVCLCGWSCQAAATSESLAAAALTPVPEPLAEMTIARLKQLSELMLRMRHMACMDVYTQVGALVGEWVGWVSGWAGEWPGGWLELRWAVGLYEYHGCVSKGAESKLRCIANLQFLVAAVCLLWWLFRSRHREETLGRAGMTSQSRATQANPSHTQLNLCDIYEMCMSV